MESRHLEGEVATLQKQLLVSAKYRDETKAEMGKYKIELWTEEEFKTYEKES